MTKKLTPAELETTKSMNIAAHILKVEAMLEVSISLQSQILANQEGRDFKAVQDGAFERVDETAASMFRALEPGDR